MPKKFLVRGLENATYGRIREAIDCKPIDEMLETSDDEDDAAVIERMKAKYGLGAHLEIYRQVYVHEPKVQGRRHA